MSEYTDTKALILDANGVPIPQSWDPIYGRWVADTDAPLTYDVDFSKTSLLRDANLIIIPQYFNVQLRKWVPRTPLTSTGEGGSLVGPQGPAGPRGENGKSAYDLAVENGFTGTLVDYLVSLVGSDGADGQNGLDGKSAYDLAVLRGYVGTEEQWLASLKGERGSDGVDGQNGLDGKSAYELAVENGFTGSVTTWLESLKGETGERGADGLNGLPGANGKSAYELAQDAGFVGTETEWRQSLVGPQGPAGIDGVDGKSAFELAQENGFTGTLYEWFQSLKGKDADLTTINETIATLVTSSNTQVFSEEGVHGLRFYNNELSIKIGEEWRVIQVGGTGSGENGADGKNAYELALENGFVGDVTTWLASLKGEQGPPGADASLILPLSADDVADTTNRVLVSPNERAQIGANTTDISSHSQRIYTLEQNAGNGTSTDEKVKMNANGVAGYLEDLVDGNTIVNENDKLEVPFINALTVTPQDLNDMPSQINALSNVTGSKEVVNTIDDLPIPVPSEGTVIVRSDRDYGGASTFYTSDGVNWNYVNTIGSDIGRDFTVDGIDLNTETVGMLPKTRYEKQDASETPFLDADNNIAARNVSDALKELFQSASNIKTSWASVTGLNLNKNNTAQEFTNETLRLKNKLANNLNQKGVNAHPSNRLEEMIDKVPNIPNVSLAGAIKRTPRASYTAGSELRIPLSQPFALSDIATTPVEYVQGTSNIVHYNSSFAESERSNFSPNEYVEFVNGMKLKTQYQNKFQMNPGWDEQGSLHSILIEKDKWARIDKLNVTSGGTTVWQPKAEDDPQTVINPVFRSGGTLSISASGNAGYSMNIGRPLGSGIFYYEVVKTGGTTANNRTGIVNTTGSFNYTSGSYYSSGLTSIPKGTRIGILLDLRDPNVGKIRFTRDGTTWVAWRNITGATGTILKGTMYIAVNNSASGSTSYYTVNVGNEAFSYSIPKEFLSELSEIHSFNGQMVYKMNNQILVFNEGEYKTYNAGWQPVSTTLPTLEQFAMNGMKSLSPLLDRVDGISPIDSLNGDIEFFTLAEDQEAQVFLEKEAVPIPQTLEMSTDITLAGIDRIESFELTANDNSKIAISFDSGANWLSYSENSWIEIDSAHDGMMPSEFNALTNEQIATIRNDRDFIRFQFSLTDDAQFDELRIKVSLQGVERILPSDAYDLDYDQQNKTLIYTLKRDMTLSVNYVDG